MVFWDELGKQKTVQDAKTAADNLYGLPATLLIFGSAGGLYRLHLTFG